jgi:hypothetical protein
LVVSALTVAEQGNSAQAQQRDMPPDFRQLLQKLANFSPDVCGPPYGKIEDPTDVEDSLFEKAAEILVIELNATPAGAGAPHERAIETLKKLEQTSAVINGSQRQWVSGADYQGVWVFRLGRQGARI